MVLSADERTCFDGAVVISAPSDTVLDLPYDYRFIQQCNSAVLVYPPLDNDHGATHLTNCLQLVSVRCASTINKRIHMRMI
jgi:hypothetical protein